MTATGGAPGASSPAVKPTRSGALLVALLAVVAYVPLLLTRTGEVAADTKQYLYLDPGRLLERAPFMWDPNVALGTVTHQNIGYLFPAGPFYWLFDALGSPDWVAQRLWLGSILFLAGLGVLYLLRTLAVRGPGVAVAAVLYMLSPYSIQYASRLSILLVAWAALPWMIALTARALRDGGWRYPAALAIVIQLAGSVNATALLFALVGPTLWVVHAIWVAREVSVREAARAAWRIVVLTLLTSLWWIVGLSVQAGYGLNVLRYTETVEAVATAGLAGEVVRGLGYWFFYGGDKLGPWIEAASDYTQRRWLLAIGYGIPILALVAAAFVRWRHRVFFVALIVVGVAIAVGTHPYDDPSPFGSVVKAFGEGSTVGLALRSVGRAIPLIALGVAVLLGVGANLLVERWTSRGMRRVAVAVCAGLCVLAAANLPALWTGSFYGENLVRPEEVPQYWEDAIAALDQRPHETRILELPGADFSNYRWGSTVEPITPGLTDRPYVARELIPYGSAASADLLAALDRRLQLGILEPDGVAPIVRLLSAGDVVLREDLEVERFDLVRPRETMIVFAEPGEGLGDPASYGPPAAEPLSGDRPIVDARALGLPAGTPVPASVVVVPVRDTRPIVRAEAGAPVLLVSADADGLVDLAQAGLINDSVPIRYSASLSGDALERAIADDAFLVVTDTNRKRARRWDNVHDNVGYTERLGEEPLETDTFDNPLDLFPDAPDDAYTVMEQRGVHVSASGYGMQARYVPSDRPARAFDDDPATAWRVGAFGQTIGQRIRADLEQPITTDRVDLVQPQRGPRDRSITRVTLRFADESGEPVGDEVSADLGPASLTADGQTIRFPERAFSRFELVIDDDTVGEQPAYPHESSVGFAEIRLRDDAPGAQDVTVDEVVRMPTDLVGAPAAASLERPLAYEMTRLRTVLGPPNIAEEEPNLVRSFLVPAAREFGVLGTARISATAPDDVVDRALGLPDAGQGGVTATSSSRLPTSFASRASSAIDGDHATAWTPDVGDPTGSWIEVATAAPVTFDRLDLAVVADGRHSVPTRVTISAGGETRTVDVPAVTDEEPEGSTTVVPLTFDALTGDDVRVTVDAVRPVTATEYYSSLAQVLPFGIAELGIPGVTRAPVPATVPDACRSDLLTIDGDPIAVRAVGDGATAASGGALTIEACDREASIALGKGTHELRSAPGATTGIDVDGMVLGSAPGGGSVVLDRQAAVALEQPTTPAPELAVTDDDTTTIRATVRGAEAPFWLVLGESFNEGWRAEVDGRDLGEPQLIDGMANGWKVDPGDAEVLDVTITWTPQSRVWIAIAISGLAMLACAALALFARRRSSGRAAYAPPTARSPFETDGGRPTRRAMITTIVAATLAAGLLATPWVGVAVGAATFVALLRPRGRALLSIGAPIALVAAGAFVTIQQARHGYPPVFEWPTYFDDVHVIGWLAVLLLGADALCDVVRSRREVYDA
jgi:arabinofuranan 3-O-arabinosyltransferase